MRTYYPLFRPQSATKTQTTTQSESVVEFYGRVVDIILDDTHKSYKERGGARSINGVFYDPIESTTPDEKQTSTQFAYQSSRLVQIIPQIGEIVKLTTKPSTKIEIVGPTTDTYYTEIVNIWNHPKNNQYLNVNKTQDINDKLQKELSDSYTANPVKSYQGDVHLQGRQGQSFRFTNRLVTETEITHLPVAVFRLGSKPTAVPYQLVQENINTDYSSIYITSDHSIPLRSIRPFDTVYKSTPVTSTDTYKGEQILVNTGRFVVNAKVDSILLSTNKAIAMTADTLHLQSKDYTAVDGSKIYLGAEALKAPLPEPVLKGNQTVNVLGRIVAALQSIAQEMATAVTVSGSPIPGLNFRGSTLVPVLSELEQQLSKLKSTKVYVS
jgi:hypothetical protein